PYAAAVNRAGAALQLPVTSPTSTAEKSCASSLRVSGPYVRVAGSKRQSPAGGPARAPTSTSSSSRASSCVTTPSPVTSAASASSPAHVRDPATHPRIHAASSALSASRRSPVLAGVTVPVPPTVPSSVQAPSAPVVREPSSASVPVSATPGTGSCAPA